MALFSPSGSLCLFLGGSRFKTKIKKTKQTKTIRNWDRSEAKWESEWEVNQFSFKSKSHFHLNKLFRVLITLENILTITLYNSSHWKWLISLLWRTNMTLPSNFFSLIHRELCADNWDFNKKYFLCATLPNLLSHYLVYDSKMAQLHGYYWMNFRWCKLEC